MTTTSSPDASEVRERSAIGIQGALPIAVPHYRRPARGPASRRTTEVPAGIGDMVLDFHLAFDLPRHREPTLAVAPELAALRLRLLAEESRELEEAIVNDDLVSIADALADITYVVFGTAVTYGIDLEAVVREVHRANMSKLGADGRPVMRGDGKVLKSDQYIPPNVSAVIGLQPPLF